MSTVISLYSQEIFIVCSKCGQQMLIVFSWCSHKMFFYDCWLGQGLFCLLLIWLMNVLCFHHKQEYFNTVVQTYRIYHWVMWPLFQVPISLLTKRGRPGVIKLIHEDFRKLHNSLPHADQISNQAQHSVWIWAIRYVCPLKKKQQNRRVHFLFLWVRHSMVCEVLLKIYFHGSLIQNLDVPGQFVGLTARNFLTQIRGHPA